jgi:cellulose synthase A
MLLSGINPQGLSSIDCGAFTGCARVPGDEEEDGVDDLENEFNWMHRHDTQSVAESMFHGHMSYGCGRDMPFQPNPNVPLLTDGQMVLEILVVSVAE